MEMFKKYGIPMALGLAGCWLVSNLTTPKTAANFGLLYKPQPGTAGAAGTANAAGIANSK